MKHPSLKIVLTLLLLNMGFFSYAQYIPGKPDKSNIPEMKLKGKVKSLIEKRYSIISPEKNELYDIQIFRFDSAGHYLEKAEYDGVGQRVSVMYASSDSAGIKHSSYVTNGGLNNKTVYKYNKWGNKIEMREYKSDTTKYERTVYEYKALQKVATELDVNSRYRSEITHKYDKEGREIETDSRDEHNTLRETTKYEYDSKGNMIEEDTKSIYAIESGKITWKYDERNNQLEEDLYNADGSLYYIETDTYDERNNLLEEKVIKGNGAFSQKNAYKYDQNNNVILSINYKTEDSIAGITSFDYKNMDSAGNWLMETISHDNKPDYVYERTIEYYK